MVTQFGEVSMEKIDYESGQHLRQTDRQTRANQYSTVGGGAQKSFVPVYLELILTSLKKLLIKK